MIFISQGYSGSVGLVSRKEGDRVNTPQFLLFGVFRLHLASELISNYGH